MTFASGATSNNDMLCLNIAIADDDAYEEDELFTFLITSATPTSAVAIGASQAVKTIQDNNGIIMIVFSGSEFHSSYLLHNRCGCGI